jgi:osmotically inducible protein OsmC
VLATILYRTSVTVEGGRDGHAVEADGCLDLLLTTPAGLGGTGGAGTNPEALLGAAYAASFLSAIQFVASQAGTDVPSDSKVTADIAIGPWSQGRFGLEIGLDVALPGVAEADAVSLVRRADQVCPFSNAFRGGTSIRVSLTTTGAASVIVTSSPPKSS